MKTIPLSKGLVALVDDEDYERVAPFKWSAFKASNTHYAARSVMKDYVATYILMHRFLLGIKDTKIEADHIDHNGLNNQRSNLRIATRQQNSANHKKSTKPKSSQFKGVNLFWRDKRWRAYICVNGKGKHLGYFDSEKDAAMAYDKAARKFFGEFACTNF